jgi:hypothetical protein
MLAKILMAACLVASTVTIHAAGLGIVLTHVSRSTVRLEFVPIEYDSPGNQRNVAWAASIG